MIESWIALQVFDSQLPRIVDCHASHLIFFNIAFRTSKMPNKSDISQGKLEVEAIHLMTDMSNFSFSKQYLNESIDFASVHSLMNYTNLIDSCQAHLPMQYALNIELIRQK